MTLEQRRTQRILNLVFLLSMAGLVGCGVDDIRPSTFTSGWSTSPAAEQEVDAAEVEGEALVEAQEERRGEQGRCRDWRNGHDPAKKCPDDMALVSDSFCIDRWEGSLVELTSAGERPFPPTHRPTNRTVRAVARPGAVPQGYISGAEAQGACEMAGKRLCYDYEWWTACAGPKKTIFPYGTVHKVGACNEDRSLHPMLELYGDNAPPEIWYVEPMNNPAINEQEDTLSKTGSKPSCVTSTRVFDMVGNLHEWTNDPSGNFHGGTYSTKNKLGCQYKTTVHGFDYHDYSTGFRCCSDPFD